MRKFLKFLFWVFIVGTVGFVLMLVFIVDYMDGAEERKAKAAEEYKQGKLTAISEALEKPDVTVLKCPMPVVQEAENCTYNHIREIRARHGNRSCGNPVQKGLIIPMESHIFLYDKSDENTFENYLWASLNGTSGYLSTVDSELDAIGLKSYKLYAGSLDMGLTPRGSARWTLGRQDLVLQVSGNVQRITDSPRYSWKADSQCVFVPTRITILEDILDRSKQLFDEQTKRLEAREKEQARKDRIEEQRKEKVKDANKI